MEEYNLSVSSGTENSTSLFSLGYFNQDGVVKKTNYERYNIRANTTFNINKWVTIGENISLSVTRNSGNDGYGSPMGAINQSPISYVRDTSANLTAQQIKDKNIGWGGWAQPLFNTVQEGVIYFKSTMITIKVEHTGGRESLQILKFSRLDI